MNAGSYQSLGALNRTQFDALNETTANALRCSKLDSATCFRSRQSLGKAFAGVQQGAAAGAAAITHASLRVGFLIIPAAALIITRSTCMQGVARLLRRPIAPDTPR